jgi:hypothetical protein
VRGPHLTGPQWNNRAEGEAGLDFCAAHFSPGSTEGNREGSCGAGLNFYLGHFQRAERNVREKLGACGASEPDGALVLLRRLLTSKIHVVILKDLIQAIFEHALERISEEGGTKTFPNTPRALLRNDGLQGADTALVLFRVYLRVAG